MPAGRSSPSCNLVGSLEKLNETREELTRSERLAAIGQLTATVSHELRNPLGALPRPRWRCCSERHPRRRARTENWTASGNVRRCVRIIRIMLEFSRRPDVSIVPLALDAWITEQASDLRALSGVELALDLDCDRIIEADGERLRQVLVNLVQNAMQAVLERPAGAPPSRVAIATAAEGERAHAVTDNGVGMDDEVRRRLFEPLFSTKPFGLGLGLALVKRITERHGGNVSISSEPGRGTRVDITLPAAGEHADAA